MRILTDIFFPVASETSFWEVFNLQLLVFDNLDVTTHKTKNIVKYVNTMENTKKVLLVDGGPINEKLKLATQNLHYVNVLPSIVSLLDCFPFFVCFIHNKCIYIEVECKMIIDFCSIGFERLQHSSTRYSCDVS